jgi:hypothetical protein
MKKARSVPMDSHFAIREITRNLVGTATTNVALKTQELMAWQSTWAVWNHLILTKRGGRHMETARGWLFAIWSQ